MNSWGDIFRVTIWGESHGAQVGVSIDGVPAGIALCEEDFVADLDRRRAGAAGTTPRKESDIPHIVSGWYNGYTTGSPLTIEFLNENTRSGDYKNLITHPRPSHADWVAQKKWNGHNDPRGGGHFSGRLTLGLVAAAVVAKKILGDNVQFSTNIIEIGGEQDSTKFDQIIEQARMSQDSVGGVVECRTNDIEAGLGEPFFDSAESLIAHLLFSVPAVKGVEFGDGFGISAMTGAEANDTLHFEDGKVVADTNHNGGITGGITNGMPVIFRCAVKPTPTISKEQETINFVTKENVTTTVHGRHDPCIVHRARVVVDSITALVLCDLLSQKFGTDWLGEN